MKIKKCKWCKGEIDFEATFCKFCGRRQIPTWWDNVVGAHNRGQSCLVYFIKILLLCVGIFFGLAMLIGLLSCV
jgi:RNA polymerase subunit RPABC4/transcription elongation factor Spt4